MDIRTLPIGPEEAFVLSRVDGRSADTAIASSTGLPVSDVRAHLLRLAELGAVRNINAAASVTEPAAATLKPAMSHQRAAALAGRDAHELDESLDIDLAHQARVIDLASRLATANHFEVLGVPMDADRASIKNAYFSSIRLFHPDKYFGKRLGPFTKRMERIFQRMTEAHDTLTNRIARAEYEAYLTALARTRAMDETPAPTSVEDLERLLMHAEQQTQARESKNGAPGASSSSGQAPLPPPLPGGSTAAEAHAKPPPFPQLPPSLPPQVTIVHDPVARRNALARKLGLAPRTPSSDAEKEGEAREAALRQRAVAKDLRARYTHRKANIADQRISRYASAAEEALNAGNPVSALNTIKIALTLIAPGSPMAGHLEGLETQASALLADSYLERARYEESNGHYEEAARSYARSARGRPSSDVLRSAAECYLKAGTELRQAGELAREAVQIAPKRSDLRMTLAKVYEAAGMQQSAVRELERALEIAPENDRIKQWLKRAQRGGV